jgi:hypothetical protein
MSIYENIWESQCNIKNPYLNYEDNEEVKKLIASSLPDVKLVIISSEDGEIEGTVKEFVQILDSYHFQEDEVIRINKEVKNYNTLSINYDSDSVITLVF